MLFRLLAIMLIVAPLATAAVPATAAPELWSVSPRDAILRKVDAATGATVEALITLTVPGESLVRGANGLARHPLTGELYALVRIPSTPFRVLVTVDTATGVATRVGPTGDTGDNFASMAFAADGTLYAVTGDGALVYPPETLCTLSTVDASASCFMALGNGLDGEALGFGASQDLLYHASGFGAPNDPAGQVLELVDPGAQTTSLVSTSGIVYGEVTALEDYGSLLFAADRGTGPADAPRLLEITKTGAVSLVGDLDHVSKGLVLVEPDSVPVPSGAQGLIAVGVLWLGARRLRAAAG